MGEQARARAARLIAASRDVIDERATGAAPPSWCDARGYTGFLAALGDGDVARAERDGLAGVVRGRPDAPRGLRELAAEVDAVCALDAPPRVYAPSIRGATARKAAQVAGVLALAGDVGPFARIVDVGAGHGHLTRALAAASGRPAVGWERDASRVAAARARTSGAETIFVEGDVEELARELRADDLVVGLHACGALGELALDAAARVGASVVWIGCCPQKRAGPRDAMAPVDGVPAAALSLPRDVLGLANVRLGDEGIEDDLATRSLAREQRLALASLLSRAGVEVAPGEEMRGVNRRRATAGLPRLAARAFAARGLAPPSEEEVGRAARDGAAVYARARRWELPRAMLGRALELWIARDRAGFLAARGYRADVRRVFDDGASPRDVAVLGARAPA